MYYPLTRQILGFNVMIKFTMSFGMEVVDESAIEELVKAAATDAIQLFEIIKSLF